MEENKEGQMATSGEPPYLPSLHAYWSFFLGVLLPLLAAFIIWKRLQASDFFYSKLLWSFLWTYPLMVLGCLAGEFLARKMNVGFCASIGDNPGQMTTAQNPNKLRCFGVYGPVDYSP